MFTEESLQRCGYRRGKPLLHKLSNSLSPQKILI
jgi:hypothetical protein